MADAHKNFAISLVATAPSPATSGTSLVVTAADGTKFPAVPFNATIWPASTNPTTANAEVVRVTTISTDTFTITRTQEGSSARTVVVGDQISATITAKTLTDAENQTLLTASQGTSTTTTANNLATVAISGLTALDALEFEISLDAATQVGGTVQLYSSTDSAVIQELMAGGSSLQAGSDYKGMGKISASPRSNSVYLTNVLEVQAAWPTQTGQTGGSVRYATNLMTTAWTGSWTLALRSGGVTSGGTLKWMWKVFKVAGQ